MRLETFRGRDLADVCAHARKAIGEDAVIVNTTAHREGIKNWIEVRAAAPADVANLVRLVSNPPAIKPGGGGKGGKRPHVLALVGPTGAGKTTTIAKLATNVGAFGSWKVGLLTFDTHRAGAYEQLHAYAEAANLPCEVVYDTTELAAARKKLADRDVILVDTPGRGPKADATRANWRTLLRALHADETHLVVPAAMRFDLMTRLRSDYSEVGITHTLLTKLDEVPSDSGVPEMVSMLGLPMRWITGGQDVPRDLQAAAHGVLRSLGIAPVALPLT